MPRDYIQISLGLQEFSVLGWKENEGAIMVAVMKSSSYGVCPRCGESPNKVHQYKARLIEDIPIQDKRLRLQIKQRRFKCVNCDKVFTEHFESIRSRGHRTIRYEQYLYECGKNRALKDVALEYQVKYTTFRRLWFRCAKEVLDNRPSQHPRLMGIDEQHRPELFVVDIWKGYISAIREGCPSAVIIADKFHIIRLVNYALDFTRRMIQRPAKKGTKQIIFRPKHLLLKTYERLPPKESERLMALFKVSPVLGDAYKLKELLRQCYGLKDYDEACSLLR